MKMLLRSTSALRQRFLHRCISRNSSSFSSSHKSLSTLASNLVSLQKSLPHSIDSTTSRTLSTSTLSNYFQNASPRQQVNLEQKILEGISHPEQGVICPILNQNIHTLGWIQSIEFPSFLDNDNGVVVNLHLPTSLYPHLQTIQKKVHTVVLESLQSEMDGELSLEDVAVQMTFVKCKPFVRTVSEQDDLIQKLGPGLANVRHFIAVYSCKGGVGKSTVAVNLAYELARMGGKVGLLDVDVYGPSLPVLVKPEDCAVRQSSIGPGVVKPIEYEGVKMLSLGFVSPTSGVPGSGPSGGAAVMRGPMAGRVVTQLLKGTEWGELDVLVLDMPPGTGDVQLTICQDLELSGAVSVTTPSKLAATDAAKGIEMFTSLGVPTLAIVENMSYFDCEGGSRHYPFGSSIKQATDMLKEADSTLTDSKIFQFPISGKTNEANEEGAPLCLSRPVDAEVELNQFENLASEITKDLLLLQHGKSSEISDESAVRIGGQVFDVASLQLSVDNDSKDFVARFFCDSGATEVRIPGDKLRTWHPKLGEAMEMDSDEDETSDSMVTHTSGGGGCGSHNHNHSHSMPRLFPCTIEKKGRYGYSVTWADQATIIYSMYSLARAAGGVPHQ